MSRQHCCKNYDIKQKAAHCHSQNIDACFVLLFNKSLNSWETKFTVSQGPECFGDEVKGNVEI